MEFKKSNKLENIKYAIRGPIFEKAHAMQIEGTEIINLNIGNPAPFGFTTPDEIVKDIITNIKKSQGYVHHLGVFSARKAIMQYCQQTGILNVEIDDIFIGNGVSELIVMCMQALLDPDDEVLIPSPDYPLWTTAVCLAGGKAIHYSCNENNDWNPDINDINSKINPKTKAIVIINPNNPTGAVYSQAILEEVKSLAENHKLIVFSDEIYDKILYNGTKHIPIASLGKDTLYVTMGGLSKNYRAAGYRGGWMVLSGAKQKASSYIDGLTLLASVRLCSNVLAQYGIQTALGGYQSISDLVSTKGRLYKQMHYAHQRINTIDGLSCTLPKGALYLFPKIDLTKFHIKDDEDFVYKLLVEKHVLLVAGSGFNFSSNSHFRLVFLADIDLLEKAFDKIEEFLDGYRK